LSDVRNLKVAVAQLRPQPSQCRVIGDHHSFRMELRNLIAENWNVVPGHQRKNRELVSAAPDHVEG
jgi:hypothetical protein